MSSFIVISIKEQLNWIVDAIKENRPHNTDVITYTSFGKVINEKGEVRKYEFTSHSKHENRKSGDSATSKTRDTDYLHNMFNNQIAQFQNVSCNTGEQINIFLLDNPITEQDYENSKWIINELIDVYKSRFQTNFRIIRVLFSYDLTRAQDMNRQVPGQYLREIFEQPRHLDFPFKILYIDNQDINGAATNIDDEGHNIMLPRMLCDFMMLLSSPNQSYNVGAAINGPSSEGIFSLGYAEAMYYHDDVFKFFKLANRKALLEKIIYDINEETSLDYNKYPFGLKDRIERRDELIDVPFDELISDYPDTDDFKIDEKIREYKPYILRFFESLKPTVKEESLNSIKTTDTSDKVESEEDNQETAIPERDSVIEHSENNDNIEEYSPYIDREIIYEKFLIDKSTLESNIEKYKELIKRLDTPEFRNFMTKLREIEKNSTQEEIDNVEILNNEPKELKERKGCNPLRFLSRKKQPEIDSHNIIDNTEAEKKDEFPTVKQLLVFEEYQKNKKAYKNLKDQTERFQKEIEGLEEQIQNLKPTEHAKSVWNDTDMEKLKEFHRKYINFDAMVSEWNQRDEGNRDLKALIGICLEEKTRMDLWNKYYVRWEHPFEFLDTSDLNVICRRLINKSTPFIKIYTLQPQQLNLISKFIYSDNKEWIEEIGMENFQLPNKNNISPVFAHHICSKICMFQFLQMNTEVVDGIVDAMQNSKEKE